MNNRFFPVSAVSRTTILTTGLGLAFVAPAGAASVTWSGASVTDATVWSDGTNWTGSVAPVDDLITDLAVFDLPDFTGKQPNAGTRSVAGLQVGSGSATGPLTLSGTQLTLGASGIDMKTNVAATTISVPLALGANQTWTNASSNNLTVSGALSGSATIAKTGSGNIILTGANTRTGSTTISGGTLQLGSSSVNPSFGSGTYNITTGNTLRLEYATSAAPAWANISGAGTLNIAAAANTALSGAAALPGTFLGTLQIDSSRVYTAAAAGGGLGGTTHVVVKNGGQLGMWDGGTFAQNLTIAGTGYGEVNFEAALRMANANLTTTLNGTVTLADNATIGTRGTGVANINQPIGQTTASNLTVGTTNLNGTVAFNAVNTYTGTTSVRNGILSLNASAPTVLGNLQMMGPSGTYLRTLQPNQFGPGVVANFTTAWETWNRFEFLGKSQTFAGINTGDANTQGGGAIQNSTANSAGVAPVTLTLNGSGTYLYNSIIRDFDNSVAGTYPISLVKNGSGTQTLVGTSIIYSGTSSVNSGTFELIDTSSFRSPATVANGATLKLSSRTTVATGSLFAVNLNSGGTVTHHGQGTKQYWVLNGPLNTAGTTTINQDSNTAGVIDKSLFLDGGLKGSGTVTINATNPGNGVVFRNNNTTFSGNLIVNGIADTDVNEGSGIGVGGCTTGLQNANIELNGTMELLTQGVGWAGNASGAFQMGALTGTGVMVGNFTTGGGTTVTMGNTNTSGSFSGVIADGTGNIVNLVKVGTATQTLAGANTYTGNTTVNGGTLALSGGSSISDNGTLILANTAGVQVTLASNETIGALSGGGLAGGNIDLQGHTLTLAGSTATTYSGVISGTGGTLTKTGNGTQTLAGANTYSGPTHVGAGRLNLTGTLANSAVTIGYDAIMGGEGTAASLNFGAESFDLTKISANASTVGALNAAGALNINGEIYVQVTGASTSPSFKVVTFGSNGSGFTPANFVLDNASAFRPGYAFSVNSNDVTLQLEKATVEWTGAEDSQWRTADSFLNFRNTTTLSPEAFYAADNVIFGNLPASDPTITLSGEISPTSVTFDSTLNYTLTGAGILSGSVTKNGTGTVTLTGPNTYTGGTSVNAGMLVLKAPSNASWGLPAGSKTIAADSTMKVDFSPQTTKFMATNLGSTVVNAGGVLDLYSTTYDLSSWHLVSGWNASGSGIIRVTGPGAISCWTGATNALAGFTGLLDIQEGQFAVNINTGATLGGTLDVNVSSIGKLDMRTGNFVIDSLDGAAGSQIIKSYTTTDNLTVGSNNGSGTFAGTVTNGSGTTTFTKTGTGTQTLSGANTYTGITTINGGTLALGGGSALADTGAVSLADTAGATLLLNASETIGSLAGGGATGGNVNLQGHTLTLGNATSTTFAGALSGTGGLVKQGAGTLTLTGANSYSGNTTVSGGVLSVSTPFFGDTSTITITGTAKINLNTGSGTNDTVGTLIIGTTPMLPGSYNSLHPTYGSYFTGTGTLVVSGSSYDSWAASKGLASADALRNADPDKDGIVNTLEFVLGTEPNPANPNSNSSNKLPTISKVGGNLVFTFRRADAATNIPGASIFAEYSTTLGGWTPAQHGTNDVTIAVTNDGFETGVDKVEVTLPASLANGGKLFARLNATVP